MDTIEGNKIIYQFMGGEPDDIHFPFLQYDCEWNELMKVVEKIESLGFESHIQKISARDIHRVWFVKLQGQQQEVGAYRSDTKIMAVWQSVIAFIQWYKSSTTPNKGDKTEGKWHLKQ